MAYTPPLGNAVIFDGSGAPYTPPPGNAVVFDTAGGAAANITLVGQQADSQAGLAFGSVPGGSYAVTLAGAELAAQQSSLIVGSTVSVALTAPVRMDTGKGGLAASTPGNTAVSLIGAALSMQRGVLGRKVLTGLVEWEYSHAQITLSGLPKLVATWGGTGHPGVYSTGAEETVGGKRYFEIALYGQEQSFGIGNDLRDMGTQYPLGIDPFQDVWSWGLQIQANGQLRSLHNGVAIAQGAYAYGYGAPLQVAIDFDAGYLWFGYNGVWVGGGVPSTGTNPTYTGVTGFPRGVRIYGTLGGNVIFPQTDVAILHAGADNQLYRPDGFSPWEDAEGVPRYASLAGQQLQTAFDTFIVYNDVHVSLTLKGLQASVQAGVVDWSKSRQRVIWNLNDKSLYIALTDNFLGAVTSDPPNQSTYSARANIGRSKSTGKYYYEISVPFLQDYQGGYTTGPGIGLSKQFGELELAENTTWMGFIAVTWNPAVSGYSVVERWYNLAADGAFGEPDPLYGFGHHGDMLGNEFVPDRVLQLAVDFNAGKIWFGYNGKWFNSSNGSDPVTGTLPQYSNLLTVLSGNTAVYPFTKPDYLFGQPPPPSSIGHFSLPSFKFAPPAGYLPWEEFDPRDGIGRMLNQTLVVVQGGFGGLSPASGEGVLVGQQLTVQQDVLFATRSVELIGLQLTTERGDVSATAHNSSQLQGLTQLVVGQGEFLASTGPTLAGQVLSVEQGGIVIERGVTLEGQELLVVRGMFPYFSVAVPLPPSMQATVELGRLGVDIIVQLAGQSLVAATGVFVPVFNLHPVGQQAQVSQGMFVPLLHPVLSGLSLVASNGVPKISLAVAPTGLQATLASGQPGFLYDCNVLITGVQATGMVGTDPTQTNVPLPSKDVHLWAQQQVERLFNKVEPTR